jgi:hypothetical protein
MLRMGSPLPPIGIDSLAFWQDPDEVGVHHLEGHFGVPDPAEGNGPVVPDVFLHDLPASRVLEEKMKFLFLSFI